MVEYHRQRTALIEQLGGCCEDCGSIFNLEFHTINGNGENRQGEWTKLKQVKKDIQRGNIALKCRACHIKFHQKNGGEHYGNNNTAKTG